MTNDFGEQKQVQPGYPGAMLMPAVVPVQYPQAAIVRLEHQERDGSREIEWVRQRSATKPLGKRDLQPFSFR
jgi:hypothetical protein